MLRGVVDVTEARQWVVGEIWRQLGVRPGVDLSECYLTATAPKRWTPTSHRVNVQRSDGIAQKHVGKPATRCEVRLLEAYADLAQRGAAHWQRAIRSACGECIPHQGQGHFPQRCLRVERLQTTRPVTERR